MSVLVNGVRDSWAIDVWDPAHPLNLSNDGSKAEDVPSWSPGSDRVVCSAYGGARRKDSGIYLLDFANGALTQLVSSTDAYAPAWRP